jgi:IPT/TIG domain
MTRGRRLGVAVVGILAALVLGLAVGAEATVPVILRTDVDLEGTPALLTIRGLNFGAMAIPKVKLAGLDLPVLEHTPTRIVAELPEGIEAATYQLIVQRGGALPITSLPFDVAKSKDETRRPPGVNARCRNFGSAPPGRSVLRRGYFTSPGRSVRAS